MMNIDKIDWEKVSNLIPVVVQDIGNLQVLMHGYMNKEALTKTLKFQQVTFYSRTKKRLWTKGETSGDFLNIINIDTDIKLDCDNDTLLIMVKPIGNTCHKGAKSCFGEDTKKANILFLENLENTIQDRKNSGNTETSYTKRLLEEGINSVAQKVGEEAVEVIIAALNEKERVVEEASDLIYHLLVLLNSQNLKLKDIADLLESRANRS